MKRTLLTSVFALVAATGAALADAEDSTLDVAFGREVETLDSYMASGREALIVARLLYDGLVSKNQQTGEFMPEIASAWTMVSDTEIDFTLRDDVKFHDGTPLTAEDVVYTLNLVSSPEYGARYSIAVDWIDSAEKTGDNVVRLKMKQPFPMALEMLAGNLPIYPKAYYERVGASGMAVAPVGTGPYRLTDITPGVRFELERNPDYYAGGMKSDPQIEHINIAVLPEVNTQYAELLNGGVDWIWRVPTDDVPRIASRPGIKVEAAPIMRFDYIAFDPNHPDSPVANPLVRQAINHAIDRASIRDALVGEEFALINSACNPVQTGCYQEVTTYDYDPAKAKELLAEAGYPDGFELDMIVGPETPGVSEAVANNLSAIGIQLNLNQLQYASAVDQWRGHEQDMFYGSWGSYGIGDVGLSVGNFFAGTGDDVVQDPEISKLVQAAATTIDPPERERLYAEALKQIADKAYWVPLWSYSVNSAMNEDLNLAVTPDEFVPFFDATWK